MYLMYVYQSKKELHLVYSSGGQTLLPKEPHSTIKFVEFHVKSQNVKPRAKMYECSMKYMNC